jgi:hypothetical protein
MLNLMSSQNINDSYERGGVHHAKIERNSKHSLFPEVRFPKKQTTHSEAIEHKLTNHRQLIDEAFVP